MTCSLGGTKEVEMSNSEDISEAGKSRGGMDSKKSNEDVGQETSPFDLFQGNERSLDD